MVVEYVFRAPTSTPADRGASPPRYRREDGPAGMIIERDVPVPVRGGITVYADVFRPAAERSAPVLVAWSPYGKGAGPQLPERYPDGGVAPGQLSAYTAFESPDPAHWTARGYAVVNADIHAASNRLAHVLIAHGVRPGDRVAVMMGNVPDWPLSWFAIGKAGAIAVPVNASYREA
jgi:AMP-binding enzyme/X-Pro dipeptidyl-peptidase (S15 family)